MKRSKTFTVKRGPWLAGTGKSKTEAKVDLERQIDWACGHSGAHVEFRFGLTLILSATPSGYEYTIVAPEHVKHGTARSATCCLGQIAWSDALKFMRAHAAQYVWTRDVPNDSEFIAAAGLPGDHGRELSSLFAAYRAQTETEL